MSEQHHNDKGAAFKGLIFTALALFVMAYGIVLLTNAKFAKHEGAKAEATSK